MKRGKIKGNDWREKKREMVCKEEEKDLIREGESEEEKRGEEERRS